MSESRGPPLFVTHATLVDPDGTEVDWASRRHRKRPAAVGAATSATRPGGGWGGLSGAAASSWWMGGLFVVGSVLFAVGSLPLYFDAVAAETVGRTFFVGSLFFTTAAALQYREAAAAPTSILDEGRGDVRRWRSLRWQPHRIGWWAALVQLVGTVFFNVSTFAATGDDLSFEQEKRLIWAPNAAGSICFLVASVLAYSEVAPRLWQRPTWTVEWWIAALNLAGSVLFGLAAIGARYLPTTGEPANIALVNAGTFGGALCFLAGAVLLPVESAGLSPGR